MADMQPSFWTRLGVEGLSKAPLYIIIGLLFYAPFCFGLRNGAGEAGFVTLAFVAFFVFCWERFLAERWPRAPLWLLFCFSLIAAQGLWMELNANSVYVWHDILQTARVMDPAPFPSLPGSQHRIETPLQFYPQLAVFCLMLVVVNLTPARRRQALATAAFAAVVFALTGLVMKLELLFGDGRMIRWWWDLESPQSYRTVFAGYRYHGNAATFLTIGLCLNIGFVFETFKTADLRTRRLASLGASILLGSLIVNTSRAGWVLAFIVLLIFAVRLARQLWNERERGGALPRGIVIVAVIAAVVGVFFFSSLHSDDGFRQERIAKIGKSLSERIQGALFLEMWKDTPFFGFGPGAFAAVFPKYQLLHPGHLSMDWFLNEAHQDYVQFLFDWGIPAFLCWMMIFVRPLISTALNRLQTDPHRFSCEVGVLAVLIHAMGDFPLQVTSLLFYFGLMLAYLSARSSTPDNGE